MAVKTTLNAKNLEALGAKRLAELLIDISTGSAAHKSRLRMELAGSQGSAEVAREVRKRLASIARARTFINWRKVKAVKADLENQRKVIVDTVAADDPKEAFELIWQFLAMADSVFQRSDDGSGSLIESFHQACADAGILAKAAAIDAGALADRVFAAARDNGYGQYDRLITAMAPALGKAGLKQLKTLFVEWGQEATEKPASGERKVIGWSSRGPVYEDEVYHNHRDLTVRIALQEIADAEGDVDAYIAQQSSNARGMPLVAADIANRLLSVGRAEEALQALDHVDPSIRGGMPQEWQLARLEALEALGRGEEAQSFRWMSFEQVLDEVHLRAYLRRLPDFDDLEAEEKAFRYAHAFPDVHRALAFFLRWPSPAEAAKLVAARRAELNGDLYELMTPAAEVLAEKHPLAASLVLRGMIDFTLEHGKSSRYKHAARHLLDCALLARQIDNFGDHPPHEAYLADLKQRHGRKSGFWSLIPQN